ncbi:MAG: hypothetical protein AAB726_00245 [Patescibacteria group bacterium]
MNEVCHRMNDEKLDFQTFLIGCLSHGKPFQDEDTSEMLAVLERDWALKQKQSLEQAEHGALFEMAVEELEQKKTRIKRRVDLFEKTINDSGLLTGGSIFTNAIECLRGIHGVQGLKISSIGFDSEKYRQLKLEELKKFLGKRCRTLEDVWPHSDGPRQFARVVYELARTI